MGLRRDSIGFPSFFPVWFGVYIMVRSDVMMILLTKIYRAFGVGGKDWCHIHILYLISIIFIENERGETNKTFLLI